MGHEKYELTDITKEHDGRVLRRIRALRRVSLRCQAGDLGGDARVYGSAVVCGYAEVHGNARVYEDALVVE